jgi:hypothetical protein
MAWQRGAPNMSNYDCFYGLTLPLIYKGIAIQVAQLERAPEKGYLDPYKVILMSYDIMKPMKPEYNQAIADWVKKGGVLVFFGGTDAYNALPEWWTRAGFDSPGADLFHRLGVRDEPSSAGGDADVREHRCGKGMLMLVGASPAHFASSPEAADRLRAIAAHACDKAGLKYREQQRMAIRRGKYVAIRTFDGEKKLTGYYVNILDPKLSYVPDPVVPPQKCALYKDVTGAVHSHGGLLHSSSRVEQLVEYPEYTHLKLSGPLGTRGAVRLHGGQVREIQVNGVPVRPAGSPAPETPETNPATARVEGTGGSVLITYDNKPESVDIKVTWMVP